MDRLAEIKKLTEQANAELDDLGDSEDDDE